MSDVVLYHIPPSFYSQIARIALAEKGVAYDGRYVAAGPPTFESYRPWYMQLNPGGTVPTLVHGDTAIPDSLAIARYVDEHFSGPELIPKEEGPRAASERWIARLSEYPIRELSYSGRMSKLGARVNRWRSSNLDKRRRRHPELAEVYAAKKADIEGFAGRAVDDAHVTELRRRLSATLDEMDAHLAENHWLAGDDYSLADAVWTVGVARFCMLGLAPLDGRPALGEWYARVKARPSFVDADIWEHFKPRTMIRVVAGKLLWHLAAAVVVLAAVIVALTWLLC